MYTTHWDFGNHNRYVVGDLAKKLVPFCTNFDVSEQIRGSLDIRQKQKLRNQIWQKCVAYYS